VAPGAKRNQEVALNLDDDMHPSLCL
jgi:hypothetical protein